MCPLLRNLTDTQKSIADRTACSILTLRYIHCDRNIATSE